MTKEKLNTEEVKEEQTTTAEMDEAAAAAFADKVADDAGLNEPDEAEQEAQAQQEHQAQEEAKMNEQGSEMAAFMMVETIEQSMRGFVHPKFTFEPGVKETAVEKYTPIIVKYGPKAMVLFGQWQDEIAAGLFTATLIGASAKQVKQLKAEDKAAVKAAADKAAEQREKDNDNAADTTE